MGSSVRRWICLTGFGLAFVILTFAPMGCAVFDPHANEDWVPCSSRSCQACQGTGSYRCGSCMGRGQDRCSQCVGRGQSQCGSCNGRGRSAVGDMICFGCNGTGMSQCWNCFGNGMKKCSNCGGDGMVGHGTWVPKQQPQQQAPQQVQPSQNTQQIQAVLLYQVRQRNHGKAGNKRNVPILQGVHEFSKVGVSDRKPQYRLKSWHGLRSRATNRQAIPGTRYRL
jgi:hypothetical protein